MDTEIKLYPKNAKKHPQTQIKALADSLKRFGWQQPIVVDSNKEIIVGHGRYMAYTLYGKDMDTPWVTDNEGNTISGKQGKKLSKEEVKAYRLADNKLNESDWDMDLVIEELSTLGDLIPLTGFDLDPEIELDPYTTKIETPVYETSEEKPLEMDLVNTTKYYELMSEISLSNLTEAEKDFLRLSAQRHIVFNYSKIADYYAHTSKEMQELMENSALVIIDFNKAIEKGFALMTKKIEEEYLEEHGENANGRG
jgi:hypothetical protein